MLHYNLLKKPMNLHKISKRFIILSTITIILIILRLKIMNFESPKFKIMDNPLAADASIITRVIILKKKKKKSFPITKNEQFACNSISIYYFH